MKRRSGQLQAASRKLNQEQQQERAPIALFSCSLRLEAWSSSR